VKAVTRNLWAPLVTPKRGKPWISHLDVRSTRREAKAAFIGDMTPETADSCLRNVRFVKVTVTEQ